jgi:hypothetical protein
MNTNVLYSGVIFRDESGKTCDAQQLAFEDTWQSRGRVR